MRLHNHTRMQLFEVPRILWLFHSRIIFVVLLGFFNVGTSHAQDFALQSIDMVLSHPNGAYLIDETATVTITVGVCHTSPPSISSPKKLQIELIAFDGVDGKEFDAFIFDPPVQISPSNFGICSSGPVDFVTTVTLSSDEFQRWAATHQEQQEVRFGVRATLKSIDADPSNNVIETTTSFELYALAGDLKFGDITTQLVAPRINGNGSCNGSQELEIGAGTVRWSPGSSFSIVDTHVGTPLCVQALREGNAFILEAQQSFVTGATSGSLAGLKVDVQASRLDSDGATPTSIIVALPARHSVHSNLGGYPHPRGQPTLVLAQGAAVNDYGALTASVKTNYILVPRDVPLDFTLTMLTLDAGGLSGSAVPRWRHDVPYEGSDPRHLSAVGPISNDRRLALPVDNALPIVVDGEGLRARGLSFEGGVGEIHFPRFTQQWMPFTLDLVDGALAADQVLDSPHQSVFRQITACPGCGASGFTADVTFTLDSDTNPGIGSDGSVIFRTQGLDTAPAWGQPVRTTHSFKRIENPGEPSIIYAPGYRALQTGGPKSVPVVRYLLGVREAVEDGLNLIPGMHHAAGSPAALRGNHFGAGMTVGPELYASGSAYQPVPGVGRSLTGSTTRVAFGGTIQTDFKNIISSLGTKYVVRRGGVTGVFNTDVPPQPVAYGYPLNLTRFAFRLVTNDIDSYSWIDGKVRINGKGRFGIAFESLQLACDGSLSGLSVVSEACNDKDDNQNGFIDENCSETLAAWRSNYDVSAARFIPTDVSLDVCENTPRTLEVDASVYPLAIGQPLALRAHWTNAGDVEMSQLTTPSQLVIDKPDPNTPGFTFAPAAASDARLRSTPDLFNPNGWFDFPTGFIGLPFWEGLQMRARLENQDPNTQAQTVLLPANFTFDPNQPNADGSVTVLMSDPDANSFASAKYTWGDTRYRIGDDVLPIHYDAGRTGAVPRFKGRKNDLFDVVVMNAQAGVEFVQPDVTKLVFGASANFDVLDALALDLHVDLNDPMSIARIDGFLNRIGITGTPVADFATNLVTKLNFTNLIYGAGFDGLVASLLREAIPLAPLEALTSELSEVRALPELFASGVADALSADLETLTGALSDPVDKAALYVWDKWTVHMAVVGNGTATPADLDLLASHETPLRELKETLGRVRSALDVLENRRSALNQTINRLLQRTTSKIAAADSALSIVENVFDPAIFLNCTNNPVLDAVGEARDGVIDAKGALKNIELDKILDKVGHFTGTNLSNVASLQTDILELVENVEVYVNDAVENLNNALQCPGGLPIADAALEVTGFLVDVRNVLNSVQSGTVQLQTQLADPDKSFMAEIGRKIDSARMIVDGFYRLVDTMVDATLLAVTTQNISTWASGSPTPTAAQIQAELDARALAFTADTWRWRYGPPTALPEASFVRLMRDHLRNPIDQAVADAAQSVTQAFGSLRERIPNPPATELREFLVSAIMNSPVVEEVDRIVYQLLAEVTDDLNFIAGLVFDYANDVLREAIAKAVAEVRDLLGDATSHIKELAMFSAKMDGFAEIRGDELYRMHIGSEVVMNGGSDDNSTRFGAALDIESWSANGKGEGCIGDTNPASLLDARFSGKGLPIAIGTGKMTIKDLYLGFTLENLAPVGVFGGIETLGEIDFQALSVRNIGFHVGVSKFEVYLGGKAGGSFDGTYVQVAMLVGKTCNYAVLKALDPEAMRLIERPGGVPFVGAYARGSFNVVVWPTGCPLTIGVSAEQGGWLLLEPNLRLGGILGGGAYGKLLCVAGLRGQVNLLLELDFGSDLFSIDGKELRFEGGGFGVAGLGFSCDPETWVTVQDSRNDSWCGTVDATFRASFRKSGLNPFNTGFSIVDVSKSGIH